MLTMDGLAIVLREGRIPVALRGFILVLAVGIGVVIPAPYLVHAEWTRPAPVLLLAVTVILVAVTFAAFLLRVALVRPAELRLDPDTGTATCRRGGGWLVRVDEFPLAALSPPRVILRDSEEGRFAILRQPLPRGRAPEAAAFRSEDEALLWRDRIAALIAAAQ